MGVEKRERSSNQVQDSSHGCHREREKERERERENVRSEEDGVAKSERKLLVLPFTRV